MAHRQQFDFVNEIKKHYPNHFKNKKVLEVGSLNINGTVRDIFDDCTYTGIDVGEGNGVDVVCSGHLYEGESQSFDVVISCECFEHNPEWIATFYNMHRMCKPDGLVIVTCATKGRGEHGTSRTTPSDSPLTLKNGWDYYKNLDDRDFYDNFNMEEMFKCYYFDKQHRFDFLNDLYFFGMKW